MLREALVEEGGVAVEELEEAAVLPDHALETLLGLEAHGLPELPGQLEAVETAEAPEEPLPRLLQLLLLLRGEALRRPLAQLPEPPSRALEVGVRFGLPLHHRPR